MDPDTNQPDNQPPVQIIVEPDTKKSGLRPEWVIVGLVIFIAVCVIIGGLSDLLSPQFSEILGYILGIGTGVAAVIGIIVIIVQDAKRKKGSK